MVSDPREYLAAAQLAERTPWSADAIDAMVRRGILRRGAHWFQPLGARSQRVFKWSAIVAFIERRDAAALNAQGPNDGVLDVQSATEAATAEL